MKKILFVSLFINMLLVISTACLKRDLDKERMNRVSAKEMAETIIETFEAWKYFQCHNSSITIRNGKTEQQLLSYDILDDKMDELLFLTEPFDKELRELNEED